MRAVVLSDLTFTGPSIVTRPFPKLLLFFFVYTHMPFLRTFSLAEEFCHAPPDESRFLIIAGISKEKEAPIPWGGHIGNKKPAPS
jgi:hypothetical protein